VEEVIIDGIFCDKVVPRQPASANFRICENDKKENPAAESFKFKEKKGNFSYAVDAALATRREGKLLSQRTHAENATEEAGSGLRRHQGWERAKPRDI